MVYLEYIRLIIVGIICFVGIVWMLKKLIEEKNWHIAERESLKQIRQREESEKRAQTEMNKMRVKLPKDVDIVAMMKRYGAFKTQVSLTNTPIRDKPQKNKPEKKNIVMGACLFIICGSIALPCLVDLVFFGIDLIWDGLLAEPFFSRPILYSILNICAIAFFGLLAFAGAAMLADPTNPPELLIPEAQKSNHIAAPQYFIPHVSKIRQEPTLEERQKILDHIIDHNTGKPKITTFHD